MSTIRGYAAGTYDPQLGFVVSGGAGPLSSVERTYEGINFSNLPEMPKPLDGHCQISLNNGDLLVADHRHTFMYHGSNNSWSTLNDIPDGSYGKMSPSHHTLC